MGVTELFSSAGFLSSNVDIVHYHCGREDCRPGHYYGPAVRDHFLIHYVLEGKGAFRVGRKTWRLEKGDGFLIVPDTVTYYRADQRHPWTYAWVGFNGLNAAGYLDRAGLSAENPVFRYDRDDALARCLEAQVGCTGFRESRDLRLQSSLYLFLSLLIENSGRAEASGAAVSRKEYYARKLAEYIRTNYSRQISLAAASEYLGLDRKYAAFVFREVFKVSPREFLLSFRMEKASELLANPALAVGDVARSVGYEDQLLFSRMFRKRKGSSPTEFRRGLDLPPA